MSMKRYWDWVPERGYIFEQNSICESIIGQLVDWKDTDESGAPTFIRPLIVFDSLEGTSIEMHKDYANKGIMSFDGLIRPVSVNGRGDLPRYIAFTSGDFHSIKQDDLNPLSNPSGLERDHLAINRSDSINVGHDFEMLSRTGDLDDTPEYGLLMPPVQSGFPPESSGMPTEPDYQDDYGFFGLRNPMVLTGWGYDVANYPVPNKNDVLDATQSGIFEKDYNALDQDKFLDNHLRRSDSWAVAPVDFRLDKHRGIWTSGDRIYKAVANQDIVADGSGEVTLNYDGVEGHIVTASFNWAHNGNNILSGDQLFVYYFAEEKKYIVIGRECSEPEEAPVVPETGVLWSPDVLSDDLIFWIAASHTSDFSGTTILDEWTDLTVNQRHAYADYVATAPRIQGFAYPRSVHFEDHQYMTVPSGVLLDVGTAGDVTVFTLVQPTTRFFFPLTPAPLESGQAIYDTPGQQLSFYVDQSGNGTLIQAFGGSSDTITMDFDINVPHLIELVKSSGDLSYWIDGVTDAVNHAAGTTFTENLSLAQSVAQTGVTDNYVGDFLEMIIFSGALDTTTREIVEGYLAHKYSYFNILYSGHPYESTPPYV